MSEVGFCLIHRSLLGHPEFRNDGEAMAFAWLVLRASWKPARVRYKGKTINLERGQLSLSVRDFAAAIDRPKGWVERLLKRLENGTMVETRSETGVTVLTICNYDKYQAQQDSRRTVGETPDETDAGHRTKKETKNKEQDSSILCDFDQFWKAYPNKKAKPQALKAYAKALEKTDHATLVAAVHAQRGWRTWIDGFVPHPATWLNAERWADEPESPRVAGGKNSSTGGRSDTSFADIAARRRREREQGVEIPGGQTGIRGDDLGWSEGAIDGNATVGYSEAGNGHDPSFPF